MSLLKLFVSFFLVREHPESGVYVDKLSKHIITDLNEADTLLEKGSKSRLVQVLYDYSRLLFLKNEIPLK